MIAKPKYYAEVNQKQKPDYYDYENLEFDTGMIMKSSKKSEGENTLKFLKV